MRERAAEREGREKKTKHAKKNLIGWSPGWLHSPRKSPTSMFRAPAWHVDVLVAGGGPCGLMLANELGLRGVRAPGGGSEGRARRSIRRPTRRRRGRWSTSGASASRPRSARMGCRRTTRPTSPTSRAYTAVSWRGCGCRPRRRPPSRSRSCRDPGARPSCRTRVSQKYVEAVLREHAQGFATMPSGSAGSSRTSRSRPTVCRPPSSLSRAAPTWWCRPATWSGPTARAARCVARWASRTADRPARCGSSWAARCSPSTCARRTSTGACRTTSPGCTCRSTTSGACSWLRWTGAASSPSMPRCIRTRTPEQWTEADARRIFREASGMDIPSRCCPPASGPPAIRWWPRATSKAACSSPAMPRTCSRPPAGWATTPRSAMR
jgi:hypothetical protein